MQISNGSKKVVNLSRDHYISMTQNIMQTNEYKYQGILAFKTTPSIDYLHVINMPKKKETLK
jgi:hypothetical protein